MKTSVMQWMRTGEQTWNPSWGRRLTKPSIAASQIKRKKQEKTLRTTPKARRRSPQRMGKDTETLPRRIITGEDLDHRRDTTTATTTTQTTTTTRTTTTTTTIAATVPTITTTTTTITTTTTAITTTAAAANPDTLPFYVKDDRGACHGVDQPPHHHHDPATLTTIPRVAPEVHRTVGLTRMDVAEGEEEEEVE